MYDPPTSLPEVIDFLNNELAEQYWMLIRRPTSILVWPGDEPLPVELVHQCEMHELDSFGRTELVKVTLRSSRLSPEGILPFAKPFMGNSALIFFFDGSKEVTLMDSAPRLHKVCTLLRDFDANNRRAGVPLDSWKATLDWLSKRTNLPLHSGVLPASAFAGKMPDGDRLVITEEIIDLLNAALVEQQFTIIRGEKGLHVVKTCERIDKSLPPHVSWADLDQRGKTELVSIRVALKRTNALYVMAQIKPMLTVLGRVDEVATSELMIQDEAANLLAILSKLRKTVN